jgi:hypothetical protein
MTETWKPVPLAGYEKFYSVSDLPRVRRERGRVTQDRSWGPFTRTIKERILRPNRTGQVSLSANGVVVCVYVNTLAAAAFGEAPPRLTVIQQLQRNSPKQ